MFKFFNQVKDLLNLQKAFDRLIPMLEKMESDIKADPNCDEEQCSINLGILACWAKENIIDIIAKNQFRLTTQLIRMPEFGGNVALIVPYNATIGKMIRLAASIGCEAEIEDILEGKEAYQIVKNYLKDNYKRKS